MDFTLHNEENLIALLVRIEFFGTLTIGLEDHNGGLAVLRGLQDLKPMPGILNVGNFHRNKSRERKRTAIKRMRLQSIPRRN